MNIVVAESAGFCYGVQRTVDIANESLDKYENLYANGSIVNNKHVVDELNKKGLLHFDNISDIKNGSNILIRAHGASPAELKKYEDKGCNIIDATCPNVKSIHEIVKKYANTDTKIIILGDKGHPEVIGISGCAGNNYEVINKLEDVKEYEEVCVVEQTTFSMELAQKIIDKIRLATKKQIVYNTICKATEARQNDVKKLASEQEVVIVIGDKQSSNSNRLYQIAKSINDNSIFIETADELDLSYIKGYNNIGITAGASTPKQIIDDVVNKLKLANAEQI